MPYTIRPEDFLREQEERLSSYYNANKKKLELFESEEIFKNWYLHELYFYENKCRYCNTSILDIRELLNANLIKGRGVRGAGIRGHNLEIDRMNPGIEYSEANCVLACYYCNNDKSNTFSYDVYLNIIGPTRKVMWDELLRQLR